MFQASVNIDYRKAAVGITIAILIATMFFGMIVPVLGVLSTPGREVITRSESDHGLGHAGQGLARARPAHRRVLMACMLGTLLAVYNCFPNLS